MKNKVFCQSSFLHDAVVEEYFKQYFERVGSPELADVIIYNPLREEPIVSSKPVIKDLIWELVDRTPEYTSDRVLLGGCNERLTNTIEVPKWFWYHTYMYIKPKRLTMPMPYLHTKEYNFLMPIRRLSKRRKNFLKELGNLRDTSLYSIVEEGRTLDPGEDMSSNDRHYNSAWYNKTYYSVVLETYYGWGKFDNDKLLSETSSTFN